MFEKFKKSLVCVPAVSFVLTPVMAFADDGTTTSVTMSSYLSQVAEVFTWILSKCTELITFILGNPFLAVGLVLFMCGAVISFFVRIKNS